MFGELSRILTAAGVRLTDEELLDAVWLGSRLPRGHDAPLARLTRDTSHRRGADRTASAAGPENSPPSADSHDQASTASPPGTLGPDPVRGRPGSTRALAPVIGSPAPKAGPGRAVMLPGPRVLGDPLSLSRALRPLKRRVPSAVRSELDEEATAAAQAETGIPNVVLRALPERWLRLALVIDSEGSMVLWEAHCRALLRLFEHSGAFRQIEVRQLHYPAARRVVLARPGSGGKANVMPAAALNDPSGRTLVLVVTDGAAPAWHDGRMEDVLRHWAKAGPTAVVHVLPRRLWTGTGIAADTWHVSAPRPGARNADWRVSDPLLPRGLSAFAGTPVPVVELSPAGLRNWSTAVSTAQGTVALRLWEPRSRAAPESAVTPANARAFARAASPSAVRLAAHLAAVAPVTVPVMQLVQACLPDHPRTTALAEIFLSGLLRPVSRPDGARAGPVKHRLFEFTAEAADLLLDTVPLAELVAGSRIVGEHIEALAGRSPDFPAWLLRHRHPADSTPQPFARVGTALLTRLGLDDAEEFAETDEEVPAPVEPEPPLATALIVTTLSVEHAAVRARMTDSEDLVYEDGTRVEVGRLAGTSWRVALAGPFSPSVAATTIITWLQPQAVLFVGLAGGLKPDVRIGDVVVATSVYSMRGGGLGTDGRLIPAEIEECSPALVQAAGSAVRGLPHVRTHLRPVIAGNTPSDAGPTLADSRANAVAVTQAVDLWATLGQASRLRTLGVLAISGIGDHVEGGYDALGRERAQRDAARNAASVAMAVLRGYTPWATSTGRQVSAPAETGIADSPRVSLSRRLVRVEAARATESSTLGLLLTPRLLIACLYRPAGDLVNVNAGHRYVQGRVVWRGGETSETVLITTGADVLDADDWARRIPERLAWSALDAGEPTVVRIDAFSETGDPVVMRGEAREVTDTELEVTLTAPHPSTGWPQLAGAPLSWDGCFNGLIVRAKQGALCAESARGLLADQGFRDALARHMKEPYQLVEAGNEGAAGGSVAPTLGILNLGIEVQGHERDFGDVLDSVMRSVHLDGVIMGPSSRTRPDFLVRLDSPDALERLLEGLWDRLSTESAQGRTEWHIGIAVAEGRAADTMDDPVTEREFEEVVLMASSPKFRSALLRMAQTSGEPVLLVVSPDVHARFVPILRGFPARQFVPVSPESDGQPLGWMFSGTPSFPGTELGAVPPWPGCAAVETLDGDSARCAGRALPGFGRCLAHLTREERAGYLMSLAPGESVDFSGTTFTTSLLGEVIKRFRDPEDGRVKFRDALFPAASFEEDTDLQGVEFSGYADFSRASFAGVARFDRSRFHRAASFEHASFHDWSNFHAVRFDGELRMNYAAFNLGGSFERVSFGKRSTWDHGAFHADSVWRGARFTGFTSFEFVQFTGYTNFDEIRSDSAMSFDYASCTGDWSFRGARFDRSVRFRYVESWGMLDFSQSAFEETIEFSHSQVASLSPPLVLPPGWP